MIHFLDKLSLYNYLYHLFSHHFKNVNIFKLITDFKLKLVVITIKVKPKSDKYVGK